MPVDIALPHESRERYARMALDAEGFVQPHYPFAAIVGQPMLTRALLLNAANPALWGVLIVGERGTAKSTAVRALADVLPDIDVVAGCAFQCDPHDPDHLCADCAERAQAGPLPVETRPVSVVELPVNASEDAVVGSLDFQFALKGGGKSFQPGLLARAHRGIMYVDEVNLLDDHLVDILLDVAASGVNRMEREGISVMHPSQFILVGTMNPEEGGLRPQLLDRFGLSVTLSGLADAEERVEVLRRRGEFDNDADAFTKRYDAEQRRLRRSVVNARDVLSSVEITPKHMQYIAKVARLNRVAGHRCDILLSTGAQTIAAWDNRVQVTIPDIQEAALFVLPHRMAGREILFPAEDDMIPEGEGMEQGDGDADGELSQEQLEQMLEEGGEVGPDAAAQQRGAQKQQMMDSSDDSGGTDEDGAFGPAGDEAGDDGEVYSVGNPLNIELTKLGLQRDALMRHTSGRRERSRTLRKTGRYVRSTSERRNDDLAFDATIRASAPHQARRDKGDMAIAIEQEDIREKIRERKTATLLVFAVDASGSMGTRLMAETKGAIMYLLMEAYQKRDRVGMVAFKGQESEVLLPPTDSIELAKKKLEELPTGGKTPLCDGLLTSYNVIKMHLRKDPQILPMLVILTDGRANVGARKDVSYEGVNYHRLYEEIERVADSIRAEPNLRTMVIDAEEKRMGSFGRARQLAESMGATYLVLEEIRSDEIAGAVRSELGR